VGNDLGKYKPAGMPVEQLLVSLRFKQRKKLDQLGKELSNVVYATG
jgi:hypothetical protein